MRGVVVEWLAQLVDDFELSSETLFRAVDLFNRCVGVQLKVLLHAALEVKILDSELSEQLRASLCVCVCLYMCMSARARALVRASASLG